MKQRELGVEFDREPPIGSGQKDSPARNPEAIRYDARLKLLRANIFQNGRPT